MGDKKKVFVRYCCHTRTQILKDLMSKTCSKTENKRWYNHCGFGCGKTRITIEEVNAKVDEQAESSIRSIVRAEVCDEVEKAIDIILSCKQKPTIKELEKIINNPGYTIMPNGELKPNQIDLDTLKRVIAKVREGVK